MPLSTRRLLPRRAPATDAAAAQADAMKARTRTSAPSEAIRPSSAATRGTGAGFRLVLRGTFRHHTVRNDGETVGRKRALEDHTGVPRIDGLAVALHFEVVFERSLVDEDRIGDDVAVKLEPLAVPLRRLPHHLVDMLVVLSPLREGRVHQTAKGKHKNEARETDFDCFVFHDVSGRIRLR